MQTDTRARLTVEDLRTAVAQLAKSSKGQHALESLLKWLDGGGVSLDELNQQAVLTLLDGAWGPYPGTVRDAIREALEGDR